MRKLGLVLFAVAACSQPMPEPKCSGCTNQGTCVPSSVSMTTASFCGSGGNACVECARGEACNAGACVPVTASDAGATDAGLVDSGVVEVDAGALDSGVVDAGGVDAGAPDAGTPDAGVPPCVLTQCPGEYICRVNSSDAGECVYGFAAIEWQSPDGGSFGADASVQLLARVRGDGGAFPAGLLFSVAGPFDSGVMSSVGNGVFRAALSIQAATMNGTFSVTATLVDGGLPATTNFSVDTVPPSVVVVVEGRDGGDADPTLPLAWKKDEAALLSVTVDGGAPASASDVHLGWGGSAVSTTGCTGCVGACRCFAVSLAAAPLDAMRGAVWVTVGPMNDAVNNFAPVVDAGISVTRLKFERAFDAGTQTATTVLLPVALDREGNVIAAITDSGGSTPRVFSYSPVGALRWSASTSSTVLTAPTVGTNSVWWSRFEGGAGHLEGVPLATGAPTIMDTCFVPAERFSGMPVLIAQGGVERCIATISGGGTYSIGAGCLRANFPQVAPPTLPYLVARSVGDEAEFFTANFGGSSVSKITRDPFRASQWEFAGSVVVQSSVRGMALDGEGRVVVAGVSTLVRFSADGGLDASTPLQVTTLGAEPIEGISLGADAVYFTPTDGGVARVSLPSDGGVSTLTIVGGSPFFFNQPVLGAGGLLYASDIGGKLTVRSSADLSARWSYSTPTSALPTEPALDVGRTATGAKDCSKPGTLYYLTQSGSVATLRAILVDSKGLDPTAPWPKYQRDNANSGNASLPLTPWTCP